MPKFSHYGKRGEVQMVDVSAKQVTTRTAKAHAFVKMKPRVVAAVRRLKNPKGNPLEVARIAGIAAAANSPRQPRTRAAFSCAIGSFDSKASINAGTAS